MGLSSSLWTSVSGLLAHGEKMNVVGNNLANVSTIGFKSQRMDFEDFVYKNQYTASGGDQVGLGVGINAIITDFSQGSFESTNNATDLAINGGGFFKVVNQATGADYYTRAGNFNFNNEGFLTLPSGEVLQGWKVNDNTTPLPASGINPVVKEHQAIQTVGEATNIKLDSWIVLPKATTSIDFSVNLNPEDGNDKSSSVDNPLFAMSENWNGKEAIKSDVAPISEEAYVYPAPIKVYDEAGREHTLTAYFDQVPKTQIDSLTKEEVDVINGLPTGYSIYEYMLTMNPEEDLRTYGGTYDETTGVLSGATSFQDTDAAGILMKGTMIFNATGELVSQTAYTYMGNTDYAGGVTVKALDLAGKTLVHGEDFTDGGGLVTYPTNTADPNYETDLADYNNKFDALLKITLGHPDSELSWQPTMISDEGYPLFTANFSGHPMGNSVGQRKTDTDTTSSKDANDIWMELNLGLQAKNPQSPWIANTNTDPLTTPTMNTIDRLYSADGGKALTLSDGDGNELLDPITGANFPVPDDSEDRASIADLLKGVNPRTGTPRIDDPTTTGINEANPYYSYLATMEPNDRETGASTSIDDYSNTNFSAQDGYASGNLTNVRVDGDGVLYGIYSNNVEKPLYQVSMYDFVNPQGLYREGGNLYSETLESGSIQQAQSGIAGMGSITAYNIEQSNVDMAREFVQMIATQRGFQSNSKGITTVDMMLEQVINMKR